MPDNRKRQPAVVPADRLETVAEAARRVGVSESRMWVWLRQGEVARFTVPGRGRTTFVRPEDIDALLATGFRRGAS